MLSAFALLGLPLEGKGDRLRWMRYITLTFIRKKPIIVRAKRVTIALHTTPSFLLRLRNDPGYEREHYRRGYPRRRSRQRPRQYPDCTVAVYRLAHSLSHKVAESRKRYRSSRSRELRQRPVQPDSRKDDSGCNISRKDPRRRKTRFIYKDLTDKAKSPSDQKSV